MRVTPDGDGGLIVYSDDRRRDIVLIWAGLAATFFCTLATGVRKPTEFGMSSMWEATAVIVVLFAVAVSLNLKYDKFEALRIDVRSRCISVREVSRLGQRRRSVLTVVHSDDMLYVRPGRADSQSKNGARRLVIRGEGPEPPTVGLWLSDRERREFAELMGLRVAATLPRRRWTPPGLDVDPAIDVRPYRPSVLDPPGSRERYWRALEERAHGSNDSEW